MIARRSIVPLLALAALLAACGGRDDVAATVEGYQITVDELGDHYARFILQTGLQKDDPRLRRDLLQSLISKRLVIQAARDEGIAETEAYAETLERVRREQLIDQYAQRALYDTVTATEADLRELFVRANTQITARHLHARTRAEAEALGARLRAGETFEALAREVFTDPKLAESGGSVGTFGFDEMDPAFEEAAFRLAVGEISEPVRTAMGYSIIRVDERFTHPLLTETEFATKRSQLRSYVLKRKRTEARFAHSRALLDALAPQFDEETFGLLVAAARGEDGLGATEQSLQERPLVTFGPPEARQTWTVGEVEAQAALASERTVAAVQSAEALREFVSGLVVREAMLERARQMGLDRTDAYRRAVASAMDNWVFEHAKRRLRTEVRVPEDTLRAHFEAHGANYVTPERVRVREILVASRAEAQRLRRRLEAGPLTEDAFAALARAHSVRPGAQAAGGDLGAVSREDLGMLAGPVFAAAPGRLVGPLEVAEHYALLYVGEREAPRPMTFEEARPQIYEELELDHAQAHLERYVTELRERYRVRINEDALQRVRLFS